jgi:hypothetical protein
MPRVFQPVDKTIELTVQGTLAGELVENKYYAQGAMAITGPMVTALAAVLDTWVNGSMLALLPTNYIYTRSIARDLTVEASFEAVNITHSGATGAISTAVAPNNVTLAIHRYTGLSGKKAKSRVYWPGISDSALATANTVTSTFGGAVIGALDTLRAAILLDSSNTWTYGYVQRVLNGVKLSAGVFVEVFFHTLTDFIIDSMRDRLPGHGL